MFSLFKKFTGPADAHADGSHRDAHAHGGGCCGGGHGDHGHNSEPAVPVTGSEEPSPKEGASSESASRHVHA